MTAICSGTRSRDEFVSDADHLFPEDSSTLLGRTSVFWEHSFPAPLIFDVPGGSLCLYPVDSVPGWLEPTGRACAELLWLKRDWDSYGARPIEPRNVVAMLEFLVRVMANDTPAPSVVPTSRGSVQVEWHMGGVDVEIEAVSPDCFEASFENTQTGESWDGRVDLGTPEVRAFIAMLS